MIKAVIIDDEPLARKIILEYLTDFPEINVMQECGDGFEGVKAIQQHKPDVVFLDIQMPKINGFEMLELLEEMPAVIFTTAFDEYALKAFEQKAVDYLLKPFSKERFAAAIAKSKEKSKSNLAKENEELVDFVSRQPQQNNRVVVRTGTKIKIIPVEDIFYFEADDDYVKLHTVEGSFLKKKTMAFFESVLDPLAYVRVHRSFILQINQITRLEPLEKDAYVAVLKSGDKIPLSRNGYSKLRSVLGM